MLMPEFQRELLKKNKDLATWLHQQDPTANASVLGHGDTVDSLNRSVWLSPTEQFEINFTVRHGIPIACKLITRQWPDSSHARSTEVWVQPLQERVPFTTCTSSHQNNFLADSFAITALLNDDSNSVMLRASHLLYSQAFFAASGCVTAGATYDTNGIPQELRLGISPYLDQTPKNRDSDTVSITRKYTPNGEIHDSLTGINNLDARFPLLPPQPVVHGNKIHFPVDFFDVDGNITHGEPFLPKNLDVERFLQNLGIGLLSLPNNIRTS